MERGWFSRWDEAAAGRAGERGCRRPKKPCRRWRPSTLARAAVIPVLGRFATWSRRRSGCKPGSAQSGGFETRAQFQRPCRFRIVEFDRALPAVLITSCRWCSVNRLQRVQTTPLFPSTDCSLVVDVTVEKPAGLESEVAPHFCAKLPLADLARWEKTAPHLGAATRKAPLVVRANAQHGAPIPAPRSPRARRIRRHRAL